MPKADTVATPATCGPQAGVLFVRQVEKALGPGQATARFVLRVSGRTLSNAMVDFCVAVDSQLVYRHVWSAQLWADDYVRDASANDATISADTVVAHLANEFFNDWAFGWNQDDDEAIASSWNSRFSNAYSPIAYSVKQYAYRAERQLPIGMSFPQLPDDSINRDLALPQRVRDSLNAAPVDSVLIKDTVKRMRSENALIFHYTLCFTCRISIVWDRVSRKFLLLLYE